MRKNVIAAVIGIGLAALVVFVGLPLLGVESGW